MQIEDNISRQLKVITEVDSSIAELTVSRDQMLKKYELLSAQLGPDYILKNFSSSPNKKEIKKTGVTQSKKQTLA